MDDLEESNRESNPLVQQERIVRACKMLAVRHGGAVFRPEDVREEILVDAITDLLHLADEIDAGSDDVLLGEAALDLAAMHWHAERDGESE